MTSTEADHNLFRLPHVQEEIIVFAPLDQLSHLIPVVGFIVLSDEAHHSRVICKLDDVIGAVGLYTVKGQLGEEQRAGHTPLWETCAENDVPEGLLPTLCGLPVQKSR